MTGSVALATRVAPIWASAPADPRKFDRNAVEIPRYADIERAFSGDAQRLVHEFQTGKIDRGRLISRFKEALTQAETEAFVAGRRARGDRRSTISDAEAQMLVGRHSRNMRYFHNFVRDMGAGKGRMDYLKRADLYAKSLWSIYTRGETSNWEDPEEVNARYHWVMDPDAEHCATCLDRAGKSRDQDGFTWEDLTTLGWPGEGTLCQTHCRCHIRVVRKRTALPERFDKMAPAESAEKGIQSLQDVLGGPDLPLRLPAAGISSARLTPETLQTSLAGRADPVFRDPSVLGRALGSYSIEMAKLLPVLPKTLVKPEYVVDDGQRRLYGGHGLEVVLVRNPNNGLWEILAIVLALLGVKR